MIYRFNLVYGKDFSKRYGLNKYYAGVHWTVRKADADYWHYFVRSHLQKPMFFEKPVTIKFSFDTRLDIDNHAVMSKYIVDALKGIVIKDDNRKHYIRQITEFHSDGNIIKVEVTDETD